jgi:transposase-like protein
MDPVAIAFAVNCVHVYFLCPFCGKVHVHGSCGYYTKNDYGYRCSHCNDRQYLILTNTDTVRKSGVFTSSELRSLKQ